MRSVVGIAVLVVGVALMTNITFAEDSSKCGTFDLRCKMGGATKRERQQVNAAESILKRENQNVEDQRKTTSERCSDVGKFRSLRSYQDPDKGCNDAKRKLDDAKRRQQSAQRAVDETQDNLEKKKKATGAWW